MSIPRLGFTNAASKRLDGTSWGRQTRVDPGVSSSGVVLQEMPSGGGRRELENERKW